MFELGIFQLHKTVRSRENVGKVSLHVNQMIQN